MIEESTPDAAIRTTRAAVVEYITKRLMSPNPPPPRMALRHWADFNPALDGYRWPALPTWAKRVVVLVEGFPDGKTRSEKP